MKFAAALNIESDPHPALQWVEIFTSVQIPGFYIVGLAGKEVSEARERVKAAISASGLEFPKRRVVLNLSPSSVRKRGTGADLAMALSVLAHGKTNLPDDSWLAWGELGLDGKLKGAGQVTRAMFAAWKAGLKHVLISGDDEMQARNALALLSESGILSGPPPLVHIVSNLGDAWQAVTGKARPRTIASDDCVDFPRAAPETSVAGLMRISPAMARALGVAAAGRHHLLLLGPRGAGKTHALDWLRAILPPIEPEVRARSLLLSELQQESPGACSEIAIRRVSPQARPAALIGTIQQDSVRPGEFSLASGGLLIADEFPEWPRDSREALREPMELGRVTLNRVGGSVILPADFSLAATGNLCPCGGWQPWLPLPENARRVAKCRCAVHRREAYLARYSGPIMDRLDLVAAFVPLKGHAAAGGPSPVETRELAARCRERMIRAWGAPAGRLPGAILEQVLSETRELSSHFALHEAGSLRSRHKILRLALSFAAWDGQDLPMSAHFMEARCYRPERYRLC